MRSGTRQRAERASGLLSTLFGLAAVLALLSVASQVALGLVARTTAEAVAYDTARRVATASAGSDPGATELRAVEHAREVLGRRADDVQLDFEPGPPDRVVLRVRSPGIQVLAGLLGDRGEVGRLDRRVVMIRELP